MKYQNSLEIVKENKDVFDFLKSKIEEEYLNSYMTIPQFCEKYNIARNVFKFVFKTCGFKKDKSKFNYGCTPEALEKIKKTNLERYGEPHYNNRSKCKETFLERYGVDHASKLKNHKDKINKTRNLHYPKGSEAYKDLIRRQHEGRNIEAVKAKLIETQKKKLAKNPNYFAEINSKREKTVKEKYGVDNVSQSEEINDKKNQTRLSAINTFEIENDCTLASTLIKEYGQAWCHYRGEMQVIRHEKNVFIPNKYLPFIKKCQEESSPNSSSYEFEILEFLKSFYDGLIETHNKSVLQRKELDIYIPEKRVAIEFNGDYWHSENCATSNYFKVRHKEKTDKCLEKGIRLIHIFEHEWKFNKEICKSIIRSSLGSYDKIINGYECECKILDFKTYKDFLLENHIQGFANSSLRLGLYYEGNLVQVAGWSGFKGSKILQRTCERLNIKVENGLDVLINNSNLSNFIFYIDRTKYPDYHYIYNDFKILEELEPSYFYYKYNNKISRMSAQKSKLKNLLEKYDPNLSEFENMENNGYLRIYDSGFLKVKYERAS